MKLIINNPYRIAGVLANAAARELAQQKAKITRYASIGRQLDTELDFSFLPTIDRTIVSEIDKAFSSIEQNQDRVRQSLFWFLNANPFDETAIKYLVNGDREKAAEIWEKRTNGKGIDSKNFSCYNNISTLKLLGTSKEEIKEGIEAKLKLIESDSFTDFVYAVADQTYTIDTKKQAKTFVDDILKHLKGQYTTADMLKFFSKCNGSVQKYLLQKFTEEPLHRIEVKIESTKLRRKTAKRGANDLGLKLFLESKGDLAKLKSLLGTSDLKYKMIADNLAKEVMQCGIDYFTAWEDTKDPSDEGLRLLNFAKSIAVSNQTIERINSNIIGMEEFKDKEINQALGLLKSVKDAYITNEANIRTQVSIQEASLRYGQSIDWAKVNEMIRNSIDWDKVVELILSVIPKPNVEKIKKHQDVSKQNEYKKLVEFIINKLSVYQLSKVFYIKYWQTVSKNPVSTTIPRKPTPVSRPSPTASSDDELIPDWLKWVGGIILFFILIRACAG